MPWKKAARVVLHRMGGLEALRIRHRRDFGVLMFHSFQEQDRANVESICSRITRHFSPVSLSEIVEAMEGGPALPDHALAVTVDDGYRNFLLHGHPIFRRYRIPVTLYAVAGFAGGRLWLWPDQIEFGVQHAERAGIRAEFPGGEVMELPLRTPSERAAAQLRLTERLKEIPNQQRLDFVARFGELCGIEIPRDPPAGREAMSWGELRAVAAEGVEIGCHTETHPILSRISSPAELSRETRGAKELMEEKLGLEVRHFCYPNGRPEDIGEAAAESVRAAGFATATVCSWGFNTLATERLQIRRIPFTSDTDLDYGEELLAGLHM